ncbi:hypothetical protein KA005_67670 [bacterium]|nr:hypothetical protein [bacterium]
MALVCLVAPALADAQESNISGGCYCDYETRQTICTYEVFSGTPALSHMIYPMVPVCDDQYTVTSDFFDFDTLQLYQDNFCGEIYGMKADQELEEGQTASFTITYDGLFPTGMGIVYAALKGGPNCQIFPIEGVIDCTFQPECEFSLDFTVYDFYIRKPGVLAGCLATMAATSNLPISITFESFGDLNPVQASGSIPIPAFYATTPAELPDPPAQFLAPVDFNQQVVIIPADEAEHRFSIWSKLMVGKEISACEYMDDAIIRVVIENLEDYIDPEL